MEKTASSSFNRVAFPTEPQLRSMCASLCEANPDAPRLKTIASVGAYDADLGETTIDGRRLSGTLAYLLHSGFMIDPEFEIDVVNFSNNRDFLAEDKKADLVFISFILAGHSYMGTRSFSQRLFDYAKTVPQSWRVFGTALSDDHTEAGWNNRLKAADAKVVATYGGTDEIGTRFIAGAREPQNGFTTLLPSSREHVSKYATLYNDRPADTETNIDLKLHYNDAATDVPMPWLGFTAAPGYLRATSTTLSLNTVLGRKSHETALKL